MTYLKALNKIRSQIDKIYYGCQVEKHNSIYYNPKLWDVYNFLQALASTLERHHLRELNATTLSKK
jgi:hypothetical protein